MKTELTTEESGHLISLGVDPKLASQTERVKHPISENEYNVEIFTLADILSILPKEIEYKRETYSLEMTWDNEFEQWCVGYNLLHLEHAPELIDALYQLLIYVLTNFPNEIRND